MKRAAALLMTLLLCLPLYFFAGKTQLTSAESVWTGRSLSEILPTLYHARDGWFDHLEFTGISSAGREYDGTNSGTGASDQFVTSVQDGQHMGIVSFDTGSTSTGSTAIRTGPSSMVVPSDNNPTIPELMVEWLSRLEDLSDDTETYTFRCGFGDNSSADHIDGFYFSYIHSANSGNWQTVSADAGSRTTKNSSSAVAADTWYRLRIEVANDADVITATYSVNGTVIGTHTSASDQIPDAGDAFGPNCMIIKSNGSTERTAYVDYVTTYVILTGR